MKAQFPCFLLSLMLASASVPQSVRAQGAGTYASAQETVAGKAAPQRVAVTSGEEMMKDYADRYAVTAESAKRLALANEFFGYLYGIGYIEEPVTFPAGSHIDSVDVNVWFYLSEWFYNEGDYGKAVQYIEHARERCTDNVDEVSKSDVYGMVGGAYFRTGDYEKAAEALLQCYETDRKSGDYDRLSATLNSIGCVFVAGGRAQEAEKYVMEGIAANVLTNNLARRAVLYGTASEMYTASGDMEKALQYAEGALDITRETGDSMRIGIRLSQTANVQLAMGMVAEAEENLSEAIPLLRRTGNMHSWGICMNQMGDIFASQDKEQEAAEYYREAAALFLRQRDLRNELHAREGLYRVTKTAYPAEAMLHLERAKVLQDSIYRQQTGEALGKYNAIYYNDILQERHKQSEHQKKVILGTSISLAVLVLFVIAAGVFYTWKSHKRKQTDYEKDISSLQDRYDDMNKRYRKIVMQKMKEAKNFSDEDRLFLGELIDAINAEAEQGIVSMDKIAARMHMSVAGLRRNIHRKLATTPQAYVLQVRMHKAKYLLENYRDISIAEVSERCGYAQLPNFTRAFQRYYGISPKDVRASQKQEEKP